MGIARKAKRKSHTKTEKKSKKNDIIVKRPPVIYHPPPEIYHRPPIIVHRPPLVIRRPPIIYHQPPVIVHRPAVVYHQPPLVFHQPPPAVSQPILKSHDTFMMHPATRLSHMGSMVTNSGTYVGVPEHRFMYQGGMGFFNAPHDETMAMHGGDHAVEGSMGGEPEGIIEGGEHVALDHGGFEHGGFDHQVADHGSFDHGGMVEMNPPPFVHGAYGRDQVEQNDEQGGGEQQEGNYAREESRQIESRGSSQKDVSEKRKKIARPDAKPLKRTAKKSLKKIVKRQIMTAYPREYEDYQRTFDQGYAPVYHERKRHKTRVDVDVVGKRSAENTKNAKEDHFLF